jgi:hypothetical protein
VQLGGEQRLKVCEAIKKALPTYEELEQLVSFEFNLDLPDIVSRHEKQSTVVFDLVRWAERNDWVPRLTSRARKLNPENQLLAAIDDLIKASATRAKSLAKYVPPDRCSACLVGQRRVFINRRTFRRVISDMKEDSGPRILYVNGAEGLGKSHSLHLVSYVVSNGSHTEFGEIDLNRAPSKQIKPHQLAQSLAVRLGFPINDDIFIQEAQESWWSYDLAAWLARKAEQCGKPCWIVLDGFEHRDVPQATHEFIQHLMHACAKHARLGTQSFSNCVAV